MYHWSRKKPKNHDVPIINSLPNLISYDVTYIGSPFYYGVMSEEMVTVLKDKDYKGKIIRPFITHEGFLLCH